MKKYIKPLFLAIFNNAFLLIFMYMLNDFAYWGILCTLIIGLGWFISFSMLVVGVRYTKVPKDIAHCLEMEKVLSTECIKDSNSTKVEVKNMFDLSKEEVIKTLENYEKIMDRVGEVVDEIGFTNIEFDTFDSEKTDFGKDKVYITAYDSHYDLYDSRGGSFPLDFLFEDEERHKDWYKNKQEQAKKAEERAEEQRQKEQELAELQRLKEKYEK